MQLPRLLTPTPQTALHSREESRVLKHLASDFRCLAWH